jgi:adenine C2-methylase RlmN of 23S rRNA A2503 and tRNA A37/ActR/RegA family two-component response regulator
MKTRVLIVDSNPQDLMTTFVSIVEDTYDREIVVVKTIAAANREITKSLIARDPFNIVFVDIKVGKNSGIEFARRLIDIIVDVNVIIITRSYDQAANIPFGVDAVVIKSGNQTQMSNNLVGIMRELAQPIRKNKYPLDVKLNMWRFSQHMSGVDALVPFTKAFSGQQREQVEKITSLTSDHRWINCVTYPRQPGDKEQPLAIQTTIGCNQMCRFCINWRNQEGGPYIRPLTSGEMISQVYLAMLKTRVSELFSEDNPLGLIVNFSGAGDGLVNNLHNCVKVIEQLSRIRNPLVSFILTSVGQRDKLREYLKHHIRLPRVIQYWSANSTRLRGWLMPGTRNPSLKEMDSLMELRDLYQEIAERTGRPVTASFAVFKGVNDTKYDVEKIVELFRGRPFRIKLMAGCPGSLRGIPDISPEEVKVFQRRLIEAGIKDCRYREIYGVEEGEYSGCGRTEADFIARK